jgi:hypothetical protein
VTPRLLAASSIALAMYQSHYREASVVKPAVTNVLKRLVGAWRFELQTSCAQGRRATRLRYAPT